MSAWRETSVARPAQYASSGCRSAAARQKSAARPVPTARPSSRSARANSTSVSSGPELVKERRQRLSRPPEIVVVLDGPAERLLREAPVAVERLRAEQDGVRAGPHGLQQRALEQELGPVELVDAAAGVHLARLEGAHVQQLPRVVPLVERLVRVDALVALKADQLGIEDGGEHFRHL